MFDLRKLFVREARAQKGHEADPESDYHPSDRKGDGLEVEYQGIIATQFRRWGILTGCVTVEVRQIGRAPDGYDVFVGMVRLAKWDRASSLRLLIGLPMLEAKIRKTVRGTWLADYSHFGGLWLHASEQLHAQGHTAELRDLLVKLVPPSPPAAGAPVPGPSSAYSSSLPPHGQEAPASPVTGSSLGAAGGSAHSEAPVSN